MSSMAASAMSFLSPANVATAWLGTAAGTRIPAVTADAVTGARARLEHRNERGRRRKVSYAITGEGSPIGYRPEDPVRGEGGGSSLAADGSAHERRGRDPCDRASQPRDMKRNLVDNASKRA